MGEYLDKRRRETEERTKRLREKLGDAAKLAEGRACVYATGSFGRREAGKNSDLDLFIVGKEDEKGRALSRLDEICIKADLIEANRNLGITEFSGDGEYLVHYTADELVKSLGHPEDDAKNTFTARLLLLLESTPLIGERVYQEAIDQVIAAYWGEFEEHKNDFVPGFFVNDLLRLWRTFCVNYEARTTKEPDEKKAKRKLKNYKLKHSRLLTCYSAIAYLLATFAAHETVTPTDAREMVSLTPTRRLEALSERFGADQTMVHELLASYERFLETADTSEQELTKQFLDSRNSGELLREANQFGDKVAKLLESVGKESRLYRLLLV